MTSGPITSWQIDGETMETVTDFLFLGSKITPDDDCSHEIKRCLGTLSASFWCLCQKLSLSPLYFNKTLLHKSSERSSLVSGPGLNSSPLGAKNPGVFAWFNNNLSFLCNIALYSIGPCFYHQSHPQLGILFALAPSLLCGVISPLFSSSILDTYRPVSSSFSVLSFCVFILFMGFSRQEYWSGLLFHSPVDHILSEFFTMTCPSWVALHDMVHSFIELDKAVVHVIRLVSFLWLCFSVCLLSNGEG